MDYIAESSYPCEIPQTPGNLSRCGQSQKSEAFSVALTDDSHVEHLFPRSMSAFPETNIVHTYLLSWPYETPENSRMTVSSIPEDLSIEVVLIASLGEGQARSSEISLVTKLISSSGKAT